MTASAKALRATTIIPDNLYVNRDADRQLEAIIEDMGRPGYVLVARQMGKTNLLLKMKRRREAGGDLVLYFDLSMRFESAKDLFRRLIDGFLERLNKPELAAKIDEERNTFGLEGNAEYDRHIRLALAETDAARVIIVLDEIDSLVGHDFSDRILSQIRSMYFARANYEVYERLTYVLSGVAEPTDLIKDKNISPFNIGEKIYLTDFSLAEVSHLLRKAELDFPHEVIEAIFDWACGNPRMTWDICAGLEDAARAGEALSPETVAVVVKKLYLTRFDRPPIDHIRALAENDQQIRSSLITLLYGKGNTLDDHARSRLYLAGITNASASEVPRLKNKVIEQALAEEWLTQVEAAQRGILEAAAGHSRDGRYDQAVRLYEQYLEAKNGDLLALDNFQLMDLGIARHNLSRHAAAIPVLEAAIATVGRSRELRESLQYYLASAHLLSGGTAVAIPIFEHVLTFEGSFKLKAKHAISSAHLSASITNNADKIVELTAEVLAEIDAADLDSGEIATLKAASHYNLAQVYFATNRRDQGRSEVQLAIDAIDRAHLPGFCATILELIDDASSKLKLLTDAVEAALEGEPSLSTSPNAFSLNAEALGILLGAAIEHREVPLFSRLLEFSRHVLNGNHFDQLLSLVRSSQERPRKLRPLTALLKFALTDEQVVSTANLQERCEALRYWLDSSSEPDNTTAFNMFAAAVDGNSELLHEEDLILLVGRMGNLMRLRKFAEALSVVTFVRSHQEFLLANSYGFFALFVQYEMAVQHALSNAARERECARELLRLTSALSLNRLDLPATMESLMVRLRTYALDSLKPVLDSPTSGIGRNDLVVVRPKLGLEFVAKFKKVEAQIRSGALEFVRKA